MKKILLILSLVFILPLSLFSQQGYKSLFGENSTMWIFEWGNTIGFSQDTITIEKDTFSNGFIWKKLQCSSPYYTGGLIREDTILGKVWYRGSDIQADSLEKLIFDFNLKIGDTFELNSVWGDPNIVTEIVDSVYYINGVKHIQFKQIHFNTNENYTFIEGVGGIFGIIYKHIPTGLLSQYLLCSYKDGIQTYSNIGYNGVCNLYSLTSIDLVENSNIKLFPNPTNNIINIELSNKVKIKEIRIYNSTGFLVYLEKENVQIDVKKLPQGLYYLQLITNDLDTFQQSFFKQ